jgi:hypothetical protein
MSDADQLKDLDFERNWAQEEQHREIVEAARERAEMETWERDGEDPRISRAEMEREDWDDGPEVDYQDSPW